MVTLLSPTSMLGYGCAQESVDALMRGEDLAGVGCDGGSSDPGPYYLGASKPLCSDLSVRRDLRMMVAVARRSEAPVVVGSAGGGGTDRQLEHTWEILDEVLAEAGIRAKVALIHSELAPDTLHRALSEGRVRAERGFGELSRQAVDESACAVAMLGAEPIIEALRSGADVVLAGRCSDAAIFAGLGLYHGVDEASAWCAGKVLECGAVCAVPFGLDAVLVDHYDGGFEVYPPNPQRACTTASVGEMFLHETPHPLVHHESSGVLDLTKMRISAGGRDRSVRIEGAKFERSRQLTVRLEGVRYRGRRIVMVGTIRDPRVIARLESSLRDVEARCRQLLADGSMLEDEYAIYTQVAGAHVSDGGASTDVRGAREVAVIVEVVGRTEEVARAAASSFRSLLLHYEFPGRQCNEGNVAFPFSPAELSGGDVYEYTMGHVMEIAEPSEVSTTEYRLGGKAS